MKIYFYIMRYFFSAAIFMSIMSCNAPSNVSIWAIDDSEKIKQDDLDNPLSFSKNNIVWKKESVNIFGARNEIIAFQLIIQANSLGVNQVNVEISNLTNGGSTIYGSATGPDDPYDYRGRNIELFTEHYLNIIQRSPPLWFFSDSAAPAPYYTGWVSDCLIPFSAPIGKGGAPFSIEGNKNQAVWVDILIPKNASAGTYTGKVKVIIANKVYKTIPIFLKVYDFALPDSTHIRNMFGYRPSALAERHGVTEGSDQYYDIEAKYYQMAHRHKFELVTNVENLNDMTRHYKKYYTGEMYTQKYCYAGPGENIGNNTFSIGFGGDGYGRNIPVEYGKNIKSLTESSWWAGSDMWENWFIQNAPGVERHRYLYPDEPEYQGPDGAKGIASMDTIRMQAKWSHSNPGIGKNIPTFVTNKVKPELTGFVDIWSISSREFTTDITPEIIASERASGHKLGIYNGYRPGMGAVVSDADAVEFRVMPWIVWKYNIDQYFYWSTTLWNKRINVFDNPLTLENRVNGDGTFFYPGQDALFPKESRNLTGPLSSIRAKNWRRGAQDFEYLWLAKEMGLGTELETILNNCIPNALWEAKSKTGVSWPSRGYKFEEYRKQLSELISSHLTKNK